MAPLYPRMTRPCLKAPTVDILMGPAEMTPELQAELARWEQASDEAWSMIDQWEADDR